MDAQVQGVVVRGYGLLRASRFDEAVAWFEQARSRFPADAHVLEFGSEAHLARGDADTALRLVAAAAAVAAAPLPLLIKQGTLLVQLRRRQQAATVAAQAQARALAAADGAALWQVGAIWSGCNDVARACEAHLQARSVLGDVPALLYDLATLQFFAGEFDAADATLATLLRRRPDAGDALYLRATLRRQREPHDHVADLQVRLRAGLGDPAQAAAARYALAKELEDLGRHAASFDALTAAAAQKRRTLRYDVAAECAQIDALRTAYDAAAMQPGSTAADAQGEGAIFIVGMPRTGTTLVERLLVERCGARSAGELLDFGSLLGHATAQQRARHPGQSAAQASRDIDFAALGREYLRGAREAAGGAALFIDKMPINYLYCGLIRKALPRARILHLVRDPLDTCYAVYKTLFYNAYPFSYDLDELAQYYLAYHALMRHWHAVMPGGVLDIQYEALVADPEGQWQRLLQWSGLEPRAAAAAAGRVAFVTASAAQVRGGIHQRSVHASRRHWQGLEPLVRRLRDAGIAVDAPAAPAS